MKSNFKVKEWELEALKDRKIWIPHMNDASFILAATFRNLGYDSDVLPRSKDSQHSLGRKYTEGDQCFPSIVTTEDILQRVFSSDFDKDKEAFFQGKSQGPCRFGRYYMNQQLILNKLGLDDVPVFTLDNRNAYDGLGTEVKIFGYNGIASQGVLERALYFTRPFEMNVGESKKVYEKYLFEIIDVIEKGINGNTKLKILKNTHKSKLLKKLDEAYDDFSNIETKKEKKPIIFVTGEIYVRSSSVANHNLVDKIEELGGMVLLEPVSSFFDYVQLTKYLESKDKLGFSLSAFKNFTGRKMDLYFSQRDNKDIEKSFEGFFSGVHEPSMKEVLDRGSKYIHPSYLGEAIVTLGSGDYFANKVNGIINAMPFNCMPGMVVKSKTAELRGNNGNIPFLNLDYDGSFDASRDERLEIFMYQVKERFKKNQY